MPEGGSSVESPFDSPQVAYAEMTSKSTRTSGWSVIASRTPVPTSTIPVLIIVTEMAMRSADTGIVRPKVITN